MTSLEGSNPFSRTDLRDRCRRIDPSDCRRNNPGNDEGPPPHGSGPRCYAPTIKDSLMVAVQYPEQNWKCMGSGRVNFPPHVHPSSSKMATHAIGMSQTHGAPA